MDERVTYSEMRTWFLGCYYHYCRAKLGHNSLWLDGESEAGYAYTELESSFDTPIENLMLEVITLVLGGGRLSMQSQKYHRDIISKLLSENDLEKMLDELSQDEIDEFRHDLSILGFQ